MKLWILLTLLLGMVACGDDEGTSNTSPNNTNNQTTQNNTNGTNNTNGSNNATAEVLLPCEDTETSFAFEGTVFEDPMGAADSEYFQTPGAPIAGVPVQIVTPNGVEVGSTCDDGTFRVRAGVSPFFVDVQPEGRVSSVNDTKFLADAMASGAVKMVVFGDSIPVYGPTPWFPNLLREKFAAYGDVTLQNVSVAGSSSIDWEPGSNYFEGRLRPKLEDADVVIFSLGGNDLQEFAMSLDAATIASRIGELQPLVEAIEANLSAIIAQIRQINPTADILWILYPNYATSDYWGTVLGSYQSAGITLLKNQLVGVRRYMADEPVVLADMFAATEPLDLDTLLSDPLHLNVQGHVFYADEIFKTLGGVETDAVIVRRGFAVAPD
ncbi:MAG: SGNH/GDSL hydrolase family protein [bacterium]